MNIDNSSDQRYEVARNSSENNLEAHSNKMNQTNTTNVLVAPKNNQFDPSCSNNYENGDCSLQLEVQVKNEATTVEGIQQEFQWCFKFEPTQSKVSTHRGKLIKHGSKETNNLGKPGILKKSSSLQNIHSPVCASNVVRFIEPDSSDNDIIKAVDSLELIRAQSDTNKSLNQLSLQYLLIQQNEEIYESEDSSASFEYTSDSSNGSQSEIISELNIESSRKINDEGSEEINIDYNKAFQFFNERTSDGEKDQINQITQNRPSCSHYSDKHKSLLTLLKSTNIDDDSPQNQDNSLTSRRSETSPTQAMHWPHSTSSQINTIVYENAPEEPTACVSSPSCSFQNESSIFETGGSTPNVSSDLNVLLFTSHNDGDSEQEFTFVGDTSDELGQRSSMNQIRERALAFREQQHIRKSRTHRLKKSHKLTLPSKSIPFVYDKRI